MNEKEQWEIERDAAQKRHAELLAALTPEQRARYDRRKKLQDARDKKRHDLYDAIFGIVRYRRELAGEYGYKRPERAIRADLDAHQKKLELLVLRKIGQLGKGSTWGDDVAAGVWSAACIEKAQCSGLQVRAPRGREGSIMSDEPNMEAVKRFLDLARIGQSGAASGGERRCQAVAHGLRAIIDDLYGLDEEAVEGIQELIRCAAFGDATIVDRLLKGVVVSKRRAA